MLAISGEVALAGNLNNSKIAGEVDAIATNLKENQELFTQIYDLLDAIESSAVVMAMEEIRMEEESLINQGVKIPFASGWYADIKQHLERLTSLYVANMVSAYKEEYSAIETQLASLSSTTQDIIDSDAYKLAVDARYLNVSTQEQLESLITSVGEVYTPNRNASAYFFTNFFHIVPQNQALKKAAAT
ncbi:hypothetical protein J5893_03455 [bacterium]|nr:hypothetical protein [bacterium]